MRQARGTLFSWGIAGITALVGAGCATDDAPGPRPVHGSIGEETYGVVCDRIGAQALTEDLTGDSYRGVCHRDPVTKLFADRVDEARLPHLAPGGDPVKGESTRAHALARIGALVAHRADLIASLDAMFPGDVMLDVRDQAPGCAPAGTRALSEELARVLARMSDAYDDGTVPEVTRALGRFSDAIAASPDAQAALARIGARKGYRPEAVALGIARPVLAYPRLRELTNATLALVSPDADPYAASPARDASGARVPSPGASFAKFASLANVASLELRTASPGASLLPVITQIDSSTGLAVPSRPRTKLEVLAKLASANDPAFGGGDARFIVRRDLRGIAQPRVDAKGAILAPFVDADHDGLADTDALGQLMMIDGHAPPSPFAIPSLAPDTASRDTAGRPRDPASSALLYDYIDTSHSYAASLVNDVASLVDPTGKDEPLMDALAGTYVLFGSRDGAPVSSRAYEGSAPVRYDAFHGDQSPLVDLVYALGQTLADPNLDAALDVSQSLMTNDEADLARTTFAALDIKKTADAHPEAKLPPQSTLWDELIDVLVKIAAVTDADGSPGLLQGMLEGLADDQAKDLGSMLAAYSTYRDALDYDRTDINGPPINVTSGVKNGPLTSQVDRTQVDQDANRSVFQRFLKLVHDTRGVQVCNRAGAQVKARMDVPVLGAVDVSIPDSPLVTAFWGKSSFGECEVFHIDDMARFYLESIVGKSQYVLRDKQLRDGIEINFGVAKIDASATATTVHLLERSCDLTGHQPEGTTDPALRTGFWTAQDSKLLMSRPEWLNRNLFFPNGVGGDKPARAKAFSDALNPDHAGTAVCPMRVVSDPLPPTDPNYVPGGKIRLPACADGDWLDQRDPQTIFALEQTKFYPAIAPLIQPFADRHQSDLLVELLDVLHRHWQDDRGSVNDCRLSGEAGAKGCSRDGVVRYEPILANAFASDLLPALQSIVRMLKASDAKAPTFWLPCASRSDAGQCVGARVSGTRALAYALKSTVDPDQATVRNLVDRRGVRTALRNDGTTNPQVTPLYLMTGALGSMDRAFDDFAAKNPGDAGRHGQWLHARSKIVDRFLGASTKSGGWKFDDAALPKITPVAITLLRQELRASCPEWPNGACVWAGHDIAAKLSNAIGGPLFASGVDLVDALRKDDGARLELEKLVAYLLDSTSGSDALQSLLVSSTDGTQMLQDDTNLVPLFHAIAPAIAISAQDPSQRGLLDASVALLTRLTARGHGESGGEDCSNEIDPNQVLTRMLEKSVTPIALTDSRTLTPIEVVLDTIADVNRAAPENTDAFRYDDYASIAANVSEFLLDKQRGIEQFYAIVRNATR